MNQASCPPETATQLAQAFKACGDPLRLTLLRLLADDAFSASELAELLEIKQSAMSHHLKVLANAGLLDSQREGNNIFYRRPLLNQRLASSTRNALLAEIDRLALPESLLKRLELTHGQRQQQSMEFFDRHADSFQLYQERVAPFSVYGPLLETLVTASGNPEHGHAIEIGPGSGQLLPCLLRNFARVTAIEPASDMQSQSRAFLEDQVNQSALGSHHVQRLQWLQADAMQALPGVVQADCVVLCMVLHHVSAPKALLAACQKILSASGSLLVCELARHHQTWTREACGDVWLGFEASEIQHWAQALDLHCTEPVFLGTRSGFQVHIHRLSATTRNNE